MTKFEACHELADMNERIYDIGNSLSKIGIALLCCNEENKQWYLERKSELESELNDLKVKHDDFFSKYYDIIHS